MTKGVLVALSIAPVLRSAGDEVKGLFSPLEAQQAGYITTPDSARLFYRMVGRGSDTLIAIHGGPGVDLESIAGDFTPLTEKHVVIFYDQRGAGRSTLPRDTTSLNAVQQVA